MVSLGIKLKMPKTCEKILQDHNTVALCKKQKKISKTLNIRKIRFRKVAKIATLQTLKPFHNGQFGAKTSSSKHLPKKNFCIKIRFVEQKKTGRKTQKSYCLCNIVSLGLKLKMQKMCQKTFCNEIRFVLCRKHLI